MTGQPDGSLDACCTVDAGPTTAAACPDCGGVGRSVERITLKALLRPAALERLTRSAYRFCPTPACSTVYFAPESVFHRHDLLVPVFQKEPAGSRTVCYCFGISEADLRGDTAGSGHGGAIERVAALVREDRCACEVRNPQGSCCLGNLRGTPTQNGSPARKPGAV